MDTAEIQEQLSKIKYRLATALASKRQELGMTQIQFQSVAGMSQADISQVENGKFDKYKVETLLKANLRAGTGYKLFDALK